MGFLHEGHLSLVRESRKKCDITVVSIFVNPSQFAPSEDFSKYPRDMERDLSILNKEGTDYVFTPGTEEIYPDNFQTYVEVTGITKRHEGEFRPTHFRGVTTIVSILFNIIKPHKAFFGQKDAQQASVITRMVKDLNYDIDVVICPIVREPEGLAMSSRNIYLTPEQREKASVILKSLLTAEQMVTSGQRDAFSIIKAVNNYFLKESSVHLNYIRVVEKVSFTEPEILENGKEYYVLIACKIDTTRLIDNLLLKPSV